MNRFKSNFDHVVIGPTGVFVLDTKNNPGTAEALGDFLSIKRPDGRLSYSGDRLARAARGQGFELNRLLRQRTRVSPWVSAVVVLWAEFPQQASSG